MPQRPTVFIVDDEFQVCTLLQRWLGTEDIESVFATSPIEAQKRISGEHYDVIVSDISMPEITGVQLLKYVLKESPGSKVILMTGVEPGENLVKALDLGAFDFLQKPFDMDEFVKTVKRAMNPDAPDQYLPQRAAQALQSEAKFRGLGFAGIKALVQAVEAKDPYTRKHSEHVAFYAAALAEQIGLGSGQVEMIRIASLLHDIGKIGVPDEILIKEEGLDRQEFEKVQRHAALGAEILRDIQMFQEESELVEYHHENWDGSGYPNKLSGEKIPLGAQVIRIADATDAMLMSRSYRPALSPEFVESELRKQAGMQFNPELARAMAQWCMENDTDLMRPQ